MDNENGSAGTSSRLQRPRVLRTLADRFDDETVMGSFGGSGMAGLSPVTDLAHNLSGTCLDSTPSKRAIVDDVCSSPVTTRGFTEVLSPAKVHPHNRLAKSNEGTETTQMEKENSSTFGAVDVLSMLGSPEKRNIVVKDTCLLARSRSALANIDVNSSVKENSFVKPGIPGPVRMPSIDEHDASSRDSGCDPGDSKTFKFPEPILLRRSTKSFNSPAAGRSTSRSGSSGSVSRKASGVAKLDFCSLSDDDEGFPTDLYDNISQEDPFVLSSTMKDLCEAPVTESARALICATDDTVDTHCPEPNASAVEQPKISSAAAGASSTKPHLTRSLSMINYGTPTTRFQNHFGSPMLCGSPFDSIEDSGASPIGALGLHLSRKQPLRLLQATLSQAAKRSPSEEMAQANKRRKSDGNDDPDLKDEQDSQDLLPVTKPRFHRSHSETDATIMRALQNGSEDANLIGDFSRRYALPLIHGKHRDLKCISPRTMVDLLDGKYKSAIESFVVIDCRYPYEYIGGHIRGAVNLYEERSIYENFLQDKTNLATPQPGVRTQLRNILIFHCEFSSERGPKMSRFLRSRDREQNKEHYPALHWPEIYLLEGGYKRFYEEFKGYCDPESYTPMLHDGFKEEYQKCRNRSKSFKREGRNGRSSSKSTCRSLFAS